MNYKIIFIITAISLAILVGSYFLIQKTSAPEATVTSYASSNSERPKAEVKSTFVDMGKIKVSEEKSVQFMVKNTGSKPLQLYDISSSCGCTVGKISYQGKESKEFGMHSVGTFDQAIAPQTEAKVKVIYRPFVMPVYGAVSREVYISTNDPDSPKLVFKVTAFVQ